MQIVQEGRQAKFRRHIHEKTFSAASSRGRTILYVTERAVLRLIPQGGLELIEIAPGIDLETVLSTMDFTPAIRTPLKTMDARIFAA